MHDRDRARVAAGRGLVAALALATLALAALLGPGEAAPAPGAKAGADFPPALSRIVSTRVFHTRIATVRNSNARRIGRSLAVLRPTWISGLIRYAKGQHPNHTEVRGWHQIHHIVRTTDPQAQFDVTLNALQYKNRFELERMMHRIRSKLHNDGWFFDFFSTAYWKHPRLIKAVIAWAHEHGQWVGGNVFGLAKKRPVPMTADYLAVQDFRLRLNLPAVRKLATAIPVIYHLSNNPERPLSGGCRFIRGFSTLHRRKLIERRASQQASYGFRVSYPALFPECIAKRPSRHGNTLYSYNAFRDPPMVETILTLLDQYD